MISASQCGSCWSLNTGERGSFFRTVSGGGTGGSGGSSQGARMRVAGFGECFKHSPTLSPAQATDFTCSGECGSVGSVFPYSYYLSRARARALVLKNIPHTPHAPRSFCFQGFLAGSVCEQHSRRAQTLPGMRGIFPGKTLPTLPTLPADLQLPQLRLMRHAKACDRQLGAIDPKYPVPHLAEGFSEADRWACSLAPPSGMGGSLARAIS